MTRLAPELFASLTEPRSGLWLVRHGETEWSRELRHTGRTDVALTERGRAQALALEPVLTTAGPFDHVLCSPLRRAQETADLAGFGDALEDADLMERDYGDFEGQTTAELAQRLGAFDIWTARVTNGEDLNQVATRADRVLARLATLGGRCLAFSHGHLLRVLTARWLGLDPAAGRLFALDAGALCILAGEHGHPVIRAWNLPSTGS